MAISKVIYKSSAQDSGTVWMDATTATAAASDITSPKTAMLADGVITTGTGSGGASPYTLIDSREFEVSTTSTSGITVGTYSVTFPSDITSKRNLLYIRVRDNAGKRDGYYFGQDAWRASYTSTPVAFTYNYNSNFMGTVNSYDYGVYVSGIASDGTVTVKARYNASSSRVINGTYTIELYSQARPDNESPWA